MSARQGIGLLRLTGVLGQASALEPLPGQTLWQEYLQRSPVSAEEFSRDPLHALLSLLPQTPVQMAADLLRGYADLLLFLLLLAVLSFLLGDGADRALLEIAAAGGCSLLIWNDLLELAQTVCEKMQSWKLFLTNFLPVYGGVLAAGGEANAGAAACGFYLTGLCVLAQAAVQWTAPLLQCYLMGSMACCISSTRSLAEGCALLGKLLRRGLALCGKAFAVLLGLQRIVTLQLDRTASRLGQLVAGSVPVIGQALSSAADTLLAGLQLLKSSLGLAALAILGAEFLPLYLELLLHLLLLSGCSLLCDLTGNARCKRLMDCFAEAVRCMAAVTALFFGLIAAGMVLLMTLGGG